MGLTPTAPLVLRRKPQKGLMAFITTSTYILIITYSLYSHSLHIFQFMYLVS